MTRCEICEKPAEATCGGLDVPMLGFCMRHGKEHEAICPDVLAGRSSVAFHSLADTPDEYRRDK